MSVEPSVDPAPKVSDEVRKTTCYMCACRCGINVHLRDGKIRYIEGNRDHPVNQGVLCAKGSAGIMQHYSPARLQSPMKRVGPRGSGQFEPIGWDEALQLATDWLAPIRETDPKKLAFFTGRDQSQALTGWWAQQFGTPNFAAHGGFCSVNMAAGGIYTLGGAFWEFGSPDWDLTKLFVDVKREWLHLVRDHQLYVHYQSPCGPLENMPPMCCGKVGERRKWAAKVLQKSCKHLNVIQNRDTLPVND